MELPLKGRGRRGERNGRAGVGKGGHKGLKRAGQLAGPLLACPTRKGLKLAFDFDASGKLLKLSAPPFHVRAMVLSYEIGEARQH